MLNCNHFIIILQQIQHLFNSIEDGHVIPGLIHKCYKAKRDSEYIVANYN